MLSQYKALKLETINFNLALKKTKNIETQILNYICGNKK